MENAKEIRWRQRFQNFEKSYRTLEKYVNQELSTELEKAGIIQLFEVTFELSWKLLKDYIESRGFIENSPRDVIKQAFKVGVIDSGHIWIDALSDRNLTVHTYDEDTAQKVIDDIKKIYFCEIKKLYEKLLKEV